jgi:NAD(P)-dependent dehydrogenase (short-subunit alcohol dehydrogenase family)
MLKTVASRCFKQWGSVPMSKSSVRTPVPSPPPQKTAFVTGAGSGIGRAVAVQLISDGYRCVCVDIRPELLVELRDAVGRPGETSLYLRCDLGRPNEVGELLKAVEAIPVFDAVVIAAGTTMEGNVDETSFHDWRRIHAVNVDAAFLILHALLGRVAAPGGAIVGIGSVSAQVIGAGGGAAAYEASKAGFTQLLRAIAFEHSSRGIRANVVSPGRIETNLGKHRREDEQSVYTSRPSKVRPRGIKPIPLGRSGRPEEVARLVRFLISEDSAYITGAVIPIDGGYGLL